VRGMENARRIQVHVRFDREANRARTPELSIIDLLTQECIEVVVYNVEIGSAGEFVVWGALADLVDDFGDEEVKAGRSSPPPPRPVGFQTGPDICS
jgi:hypothetical protein